MGAPEEDEKAALVLGRFAIPGRLQALAPHTPGLINSSWRATFDAAGGPRRVLLQRINRSVFPHPEQVMENMERVTRHLAARLVRQPDAERGVLRLLKTRGGGSHHVDEDGETWRVLAWVEGSHATSRARSEAEARETALAFGRFLRQLQDLPGPRLHDTIPGFHDTPARLEAFRAALAEDEAGRAAGAGREVEALLERAPLARGLVELRLPERPVHNDAKIANVLFDETSDRALAVVDLDTVMVGLAAHDFGDLARSTLSDSEEDERDLGRVAVRPTFYRALVDGFVTGAERSLAPAERASLRRGALVITYEQALRFLTDHLSGDRYYRISREAHNLDRARVQIALLRSMEQLLLEPGD